jgi:23S rRNA G2445 N2-methylase RlmL
VKAGAKHGLGVDIDPQRIKEANENAKTAGVTDKVEFQETDLFTMDFKDRDGADDVPPAERQHEAAAEDPG